MTVDEVELLQLELQPTAVVRSHVTVAEIPAFLRTVFPDVIQTLEAQGLTPGGPPFSRYTPTGDGFDVEAGFPTVGHVTARGRVVAGNLPGGPVVRVLHRGDYQGVAAAYERAFEWASRHGYAASGPPWESYLDGPEVPEPRTVVCLPCRIR